MAKDHVRASKSKSKLGVDDSGGTTRMGIENQHEYFYSLLG
jgi:hypothetical protein